MVLIRRINYSDNERITTQKTQLTGDFLWVAFAQDSDGIVILEKQFGFEPSQSFFTLEREVEEIPAMDLNSTHLFVAYDDTDLLGEKISLSNPLTSTTEISKPSGIVESPVDVHIDDTNVFYMLPGSLSGSITTLLRYNTSGVLQETIELSKTGLTVENAYKFTIDSVGDIYISINEDPAKVIRLFELSGGGWDFEETVFS